MQRFQENFSSLMVEKHFLPRDKTPQAKAQRTKGQWTIEEDRKLVSLVEENGVKRWAYIASTLKGRIGKQCRERWYNHLRPDIKKEAWTEEEEMAMVKAHADVGNKWAEIAKRIPGRTENSIKNHWNTAIRRQLSKRKSRKISVIGNNGHPSSVLQDYIRSKGLVMEKGKEMKQKEANETNKNCTLNTPFPSLTKQNDSHPLQSNDRFDQNLTIFNNLDLSFLLSFPSPSSSSSHAFGSNLDNQNPKGIQEFPTEFKTVKKDLDLVEMISSIVNIDDW